MVGEGRGHRVDGWDRVVFLEWTARIKLVTVYYFELLRMGQHLPVGPNKFLGLPVVRWAVSSLSIIQFSTLTIPSIS